MKQRRKKKGTERFLIRLKGYLDHRQCDIHRVPEKEDTCQIDAALSAELEA